jgi:hypothetical protein
MHGFLSDIFIAEILAELLGLAELIVGVSLVL